jgi:hypothetical protein
MRESAASPEPERDPELGGRVERNESLALGYLDVRHDGNTAELKVEKQTTVTQERAPKYMGQPTQYAAADGARLSILCILDMSPKTVPVGTPENYMWQIEPALHGISNPEAPSLVTVVVINGDLPTPSSWSRGNQDERFCSWFLLCPPCDRQFLPDSNGILGFIRATGTKTPRVQIHALAC